MKILALSDEVVERLYSLCNNNHFNDVELIIGCGDLPYPYLENIVTLLNVPLLYVPGNHDPNHSPTLQLAVEFLGAGNIDVDLVEIFYSDEAIAQIDITLDATYGVQQSYSLLLETDLNNLRKAIVLDPGNNTTRFAKSIYGTLSSVLAIRDTRVFVLFQRLSGTDLHIPSDVLAVSTKIIYRTTYPFRD